MIFALWFAVFFIDGSSIIDTEKMPSMEACDRAGPHLEADAKERDWTVESVSWRCFPASPKPTV